MKTAVIARSSCDEAIQSEFGALDCFAEPVIGPAKPDPLARNDGGSRRTYNYNGASRMTRKHS